MRPYQQLKDDNEALLLQEIKDKKTVFTALPPRVTFEISRACNYVCKKCCYSANSNHAGFNAINNPAWPDDDIIRVSDELFPTLQYTESTLLGEPFLNRKYKWFLDIYRKYGVYYRPTTNGSLLTQSKIEYAQTTIDFLKCSFDAANKELYHKLYLKDMFRTVSENLKMFSRLREQMNPRPWFRVGLVLMKSNLNHLIEYADYCNEVLGVDDIEIMGLNEANNTLKDEMYFHIPEIVNKKIDELIEHCIKKGYRLRLPFIEIGNMKTTNKNKSASDQNKIDLQKNYSDCIKKGDIFGNREAIENNYIISNHERINSITANDGTKISVCEFFSRPFIKPPEYEGGPLWVESCGSCSCFRLGDLRKNTFKEIYNNELSQKLRAFLYNKHNIPRDKWPEPCKKCLCVDSVYNKENNGIGNVGKHYDNI